MKFLGKKYPFTGTVGLIHLVHSSWVPCLPNTYSTWVLKSWVFQEILNQADKSIVSYHMITKLQQQWIFFFSAINSLAFFIFCKQLTEETYKKAVSTLWGKIRIDWFLIMSLIHILWMVTLKIGCSKKLAKFILIFDL